MIDTVAGAAAQSTISAAEPLALPPATPRSANLFHPLPRRSRSGTATTGAISRSSSNSGSASGSTCSIRACSRPRSPTPTRTPSRTSTTAGGRTWTASSTDDPPSIDRRPRWRASVRAGRVVGGQGLYVQTRLRRRGDRLGRRRRPDARRRHAAASEQRLPASTLEIDVQAPLWAAVRPHRDLRQRGDHRRRRARRRPKLFGASRRWCSSPAVTSASAPSSSTRA